MSRTAVRYGDDEPSPFVLDGSPGPSTYPPPILARNVLFSEVHPATGAVTLSRSWDRCYDMGCYGSARTSFSSPSSIIPSDHVWAASKELGRCRTERLPDGPDARPLPLPPMGSATWPRTVTPHAGAPDSSSADRSRSCLLSDVPIHSPSEPVPIHGGARITFSREALPSSGNAMGTAAWATSHAVVAYKWATADRSDEDDHVLEVEAVDSTPCALAQGDADEANAARAAVPRNDALAHLMLFECGTDAPAAAAGSDGRTGLHNPATHQPAAPLVTNSSLLRCISEEVLTLSPGFAKSRTRPWDCMVAGAHALLGCRIR